MDVNHDTVRELMQRTERARRVELSQAQIKLKDLQAIARIVGIPEIGTKADLIDRIVDCDSFGEVETRDGRFRTPDHGRIASNLRASACSEVPLQPVPDLPGSTSAGSGSSSAQELKQQVAATAAAAHDQHQHNLAVAASLAPGTPSPPPPGPTNTKHNEIAPPGNMSVDSPQAASQRPKPVVPAASQPVGVSPVVSRYKEKFRLFVERERQSLPPLQSVPALPASESSSAALKPLVDGMNTLIAGVNDMRETLQDTVKLKDLQEFREMQSEEMKDMVAVHLVPIHEDLGEIKLRAELQDNRIAAIEERIHRFERSEGGVGEAERMKLMNENDPACKQIAFSGFKIGDLKKRVQILKDFATKHFADLNIANVETIMNGPWKGRKPTSSVVMEFFSRDARDIA